MSIEVGVALKKAMQKQFWKLLIFQAGLSSLYVLGFALWDISVMFSALVGCMASLLPNTYFYVRMSRQSENNNAQQWLGYAFRSEIGKWLTTVGIFALAFTSNHVWDPVVLFAGYILVQLSSWFIPFEFKGN